MVEAQTSGIGAAELGNGVRRLGSKYVNFYLIEEGGRLTLLDAGLAGYWEGLLQELAAMGRRIGDIDAVLITHQHPDHVGLAERVREETSARAYAHSADAPAISGNGPRLVPNFFSQIWRPFIFKYMLHTGLNGALKNVPVADLNTFADGELLDVPGRPRAIHVPGHTAGCCALFLESRRVLFSADALVTFDLLTGKPGPTLMPDFVNQNSRQAAESLSRLEAIEADVILPGHGEPWLGGVTEAVRLARRSWSARASEIGKKSRN